MSVGFSSARKTTSTASGTVKKLAARTASSRTRGRSPRGKEGGLAPPRDREKAGRPDRFEADARALVGGLLAEQVEGVGHPVTPVAEHAGGGGPGTELLRAEHPLQKVQVHDVVVL